MEHVRDIMVFAKVGIGLGLAFAGFGGVIVAALALCFSICKLIG